MPSRRAATDARSGSGTIVASFEIVELEFTSQPAELGFDVDDHYQPPGIDESISSILQHRQEIQPRGQVEPDVAGWFPIASGSHSEDGRELV